MSDTLFGYPIVEVDDIPPVNGMSFGPETLKVKHAKAKRERWFRLKQLAYWLGLREKPPFWVVTYELEHKPC